MTAEYPERPVPAVGALVLRDDAILLVKRGRPPKAGHWSVPGGSIEEGETAEAAVVREGFEETGIPGRPPHAGRRGRTVGCDRRPPRIRPHANDDASN